MIDVLDPLRMDVETQTLFHDGKTFVDAIPLRDSGVIAESYAREKNKPGFSLRDFVAANFVLPTEVGSGFVSDSGRDLAQHIEALWPVLTRTPTVESSGGSQGSLLELPEPYVVPGGRFREIYYWDSYFTMLGLCESSREALALSMVRNFAHLLDAHGHIPNGNRRYFLSRSQPPFFFKMLELLDPGQPGEVFARYLTQLRAEYAYWMAGADALQPGQAALRVVCMPDGHVLNRYWDDKDAPREEMYRDDIATAQRCDRPPHQVYRDLRAAAESGWDFSSRWLNDPMDLSSIETSTRIPVELNCLLHGLELALASAYAHEGLVDASRSFALQAAKRKTAIDRYCWHGDLGCYLDYDMKRSQPSKVLSAATLFPLFMGLASSEQAIRVAEQVRSQLLQPGGLVTTLIHSGQQWDWPNGWAPLQWVAVDGLRRYGQHDLAKTIAIRWIQTVNRVYQSTGKLVEKYDVASQQSGGGGEYPTQDGFGWTNGVTLKLMALYPEALTVGDNTTHTDIPTES